MIKQFEIGKSYFCRSLCDYDCVWTFRVIKRTEKTIVTACGKMLRINPKMTEFNQAETVYPNGRHSMAPTLTAIKEVAQ